MFGRDHSGYILEGGFEDGRSRGAETSEQQLVQVRNSEGPHQGYGRRRGGSGGLDI